MTDALPVYSVVVSREDNLWVAVVEGLPGGATEVEHFRDLPDAVRDLIATLVDSETDAFWIEWHYRQGDHDLTQVIENLRQWERLAERAAYQRDLSRQAVVESLRAAGLTYREIADVVQMSHQRVWQLLDTEGKTAKADRETLSPLEASLIAFLSTVGQVRPDSRPSLLTTTAAMLEEAAADVSFLHSDLRVEVGTTPFPPSIMGRAQRTTRTVPSHEDTSGRRSAS
ncbi:hypothetical protein [Actinokineospora iranica]|uniref:Uncharacterized protein n=1 Tax=Actinokineospora iranica TaxID=1271860 RepID=A0A1G6KRF1_9PSEU|nr:hypothetical protein [Actinokineospora iranica]SDC33095.1 hypothetical protein SAMN05216174_1011035 [Actinokineospora iranica]